MTVYQEIAAERQRAHDIRDVNGGWLADDQDCPDMLRLAALVEECGEVARALHDEAPNLRTELIQLAGVAIAWAEAI